MWQNIHFQCYLIYAWCCCEQRLVLIIQQPVASEQQHVLSCFISAPCLNLIMPHMPVPVKQLDSDRPALRQASIPLQHVG